MDAVPLGAVSRCLTGWRNGHGEKWIVVDFAGLGNGEAEEVLWQLCQNEHDTAQLADVLRTTIERGDMSATEAALRLLARLGAPICREDFIMRFSGASGTQCSIAVHVRPATEGAVRRQQEETAKPSWPL